MHPVPRRGAHGWTILRVSSPQVVVAHAALVVVAHVWVRSCWWVGARHTGPEYSSDAIHIHFAIHILPLLRKTHGGPVSIKRIP